MKKTYYIILLFSCLVLCVLLVWGVVSRRLPADKALTIEQLQDLVQKKKDKLMWSDFQKYKHTDVGSGVYIFEYVIDYNYKLQIGGKNLNDSPNYIYLFNQDGQKIDVRYDSIKEFTMTK